MVSMVPFGPSIINVTMNSPQQTSHDHLRPAFFSTGARARRDAPHETCDEFFLGAHAEEVGERNVNFASFKNIS